jgi:hypothetical protein
MKTNTISVISVRIRSVFVPTLSPTQQRLLRRLSLLAPLTHVKAIPAYYLPGLLDALPFPNSSFSGNSALPQRLATAAINFTIGDSIGRSFVVVDLRMRGSTQA